MGSIMSTARKEITKQSQEVKKETENTLNIYNDLAVSKLLEMKNEVESLIRTAGSEENITLRPEAKIAIIEQACAHVSSGVDTTFFDSINKVVKSFIKGGGENITNGVTQGIQTALSSIVGEGSGSERVIKHYTIATEGYCILRIDVAIWTKAVNAKALGINQQMDLFAFYGVKSTVNLDILKFNTFLALYQSVLFQGADKFESDFRQTIKEDLKSAYDVYHTLTSLSKNKYESVEQSEKDLRFDPNPKALYRNAEDTYQFKSKNKLIKQETKKEGSIFSNANSVLGGFYNKLSKSIVKPKSTEIIDELLESKSQDEFTKQKDNEMIVRPFIPKEIPILKELSDEPGHINFQSKPISLAGKDVNDVEVENSIRSDDYS